MSKISNKRIISLLMAIFVLATMIVGIPSVNSEAATISCASKTINVKEKFTLKVKGTTKTVKWSSNNKTVATVNSKGVVTGKKAGTATITAKYGTKKLRCRVTVKKAAKKTADWSGIYETQYGYDYIRNIPKYLTIKLVKVSGNTYKYKYCICRSCYVYQSAPFRKVTINNNKLRVKIEDDWGQVCVYNITRPSTSKLYLGKNNLYLYKTMHPECQFS